MENRKEVAAAIYQESGKVLTHRWNMAFPFD
jgi:hypothetical protein